MTETMKDIHNAAFRKRLIQFIRESEELPMNFRNEKHRLAFDEAIRKLNKKNFALMSALYLLTAEHKLWMQIRNFVERNEIKFDRFKPKDSTENGYNDGAVRYSDGTRAENVYDLMCYTCTEDGVIIVGFDRVETRRAEKCPRLIPA